MHCERERYTSSGTHPFFAAKFLSEISNYYVYDDTSYAFMDLAVSIFLEDREVEDSVNVFSEGEFDEYVEGGIEEGTLKVVRKSQ